MLNRIKEYMQHAPQMAGVEVFFPHQGHTVFTMARIVHNGRRVSFVSGDAGMEQLDQLRELLGKDRPMALSLHGRGILHRLLSAEALSLNDEELFARFFPNARLEDFYIQRCQSEAFAVFSLARKELVDHLLAQLAEHGLEALALNLGPFALLAFRRYLPQQGEVVKVDRHHFEWQNDKLVAYQLAEQGPSQPQRVHLGGEELSERYCAAFAVAALEVQGGLYPSLHLPAVEVPRQEYYGKLLFRRSLMAIVGLFFVLLLVNTGFFMSYRDRAMNTSTDSYAYKQQAIIQLRNELAEKEKALTGIPLHLNGRTHWAEMADRLILLMPASVVLEELDFGPKDEAQSRSQRKPIFREGYVRISGTCSELADLNQWLAGMRLLPFCRKANLEQYAYSSREEVARFEIEMETKE